MADNQDSTRRLCEELSSIVGMTTSNTQNFARLIELSIVHKMLTDNIETIGSSPLTIDIPFICNMTVRVDETNNVVVDSVNLTETFKSHLLGAITEKKSPLVIEAEASLIDRISRKYNSLV